MLFNQHNFATCSQGNTIFKERGDINNYLKNQDDWCHTMVSTLLHELYDGVNVKKSKIGNRKKKKGKKLSKARWVNKSLRR